MMTVASCPLCRLHSKDPKAFPMFVVFSPSREIPNLRLPVGKLLPVWPLRNDVTLVQTARPDPDTLASMRKMDAFAQQVASARLAFVAGVDSSDSSQRQQEKKEPAKTAVVAAGGKANRKP